MTTMLVGDLIEALRHYNTEAPIFIPELGHGVRELFRICQAEEANSDVVMLLPGKLIPDDKRQSINAMMEGEYAEHVAGLDD